MPSKPPASRALSEKMAGTRAVPTPPRAHVEPPPRAGVGTARMAHRITLDTDAELFEALREASYRLRVPATALIRAAARVVLADSGSSTYVEAVELARAEAAELRRRHT